MKTKHNNLYLALIVIILLIIIATFVINNVNNKENKMDNGQSSSEFRVSSTAFAESSTIPIQYTCKGDNVNPPLNISGVPEHAKSLALIVHDPDAVNGDFVHWVMWDLPAKDQSIAPNGAPIGATQGLNGSGSNKYMGPCPPAGTGTHHYIFELYALDKMLSLDPQTDREKLLEAIDGHDIARTTFTGLFSAN